MFLPVAISLAAVVWLLRFSAPPIAALALSIAVGYGLGATFPCDPGSPLTGSFRQTIHKLAGGIEYIGGALSFFWIKETAWPGSYAAGILVALSAILLSFESRYRGLIQRNAKSCLFLGLLAAPSMR